MWMDQLLPPSTQSQIELNQGEPLIELRLYDAQLCREVIGVVRMEASGFAQPASQVTSRTITIVTGNLVVRRFRLFLSPSSMCFAYRPRTTNSAPSFIIFASIFSPFSSIKVTSLKSTMHFRPWHSAWAFFHEHLSSAVHGLMSRP